MPIPSFAKTPVPLIILVASLCFCSGSLSAKEYIVKLKSDIAKCDLDNFNASSNLPFKVKDVEEDLRMIKVDAAKFLSDVDAVSELTNQFDAEYVVENVLLHAFANPNDPKRSQQWALDVIKANDAWDISWGSHEIVVAVIDTGIDLSHEDLQANKWVNSKEVAGNGVDDDNNGYVDDINGWDFKDNDKTPNDETGAQNPGHGTHCAGIIGAACNNSVGVCGISPTVSLMALRFLGSDGSGDLFASVKAIEYAAKNGAHVISASWGATIPQSGAQPIIDAIKAAEEKGVIFVAAAGNDGKSNDKAGVFPANAQTPNMISVAASNSSDQKPAWSNYGRKVDIASPGENILSTIPGSYKELSGTSMATPLVSGLIALMKSVDVSISGAVARSILQTTGKPVSIETSSNRRISAPDALNAVKNKQLTVVPAAHTIDANGQFDFSAWGGSGSYKFKSLNPDIATITEAGHLTAVGQGDVTIEVTDASGNTARSVSIKVATGAPPAESSCPLQNELLCVLLCAIKPDLPWCQDLPGLPPGLPGLPGMPELPNP